jgi:TetR/AcrR family transcriptional regulator
VNTPRPIPITAPLDPPGPRPRLSSEDRHRQLLSHAIALFSRHGFSGTRTKDIAAACGVSEAILFRHFATKEDLYHAILDTHEAASGNEEWLAEMHVMTERRDDVGFIRCLQAQILRTYREDTAFHRLMLYAGLEGHSLPGMFHDRMGSMFEFLRSYLVLRQREGAFRKGNPDALMMLLTAPALQYATRKYVMGVKSLSRPDKDTAQEFAELLITALYPAGASAANKNTKKTSRRKA